MNDIVIGAKILDILTQGMYPDALDALREYVQNSYDAIRRAERAGILKPNHGEVTVVIDSDTQTVTVRDNGAGIPAVEARTTLLSIGASKKRIGLDAGFRGIGRLAGIAYCDKLIFTTAYKDERRATEITFDAIAMRKRLSSTMTSDDNTTVFDLLNQITTHKEIDRAPGAPFFEVKLIKVDQKNCKFLNSDEVRRYLKQVAPVDFELQSFIYGRSIINPFLEEHDALRTINLTLEVNGRQETISKPYKTRQKAGNKKNNLVHINDIEKIRDENEPPRWIGWIATAADLQGEIEDEEVRGIRLRSNNILIGDHRTFSRIFEKVRKSHARFNSWYSGEIHVLDTSAIPNARRDFFEDNETWHAIETDLIALAKKLKDRAYQSSSDRNREVTSIERDADDLISEIDQQASHGFPADAAREETLTKIAKEEGKIAKAMAGDRTQDELEALMQKKAEVAACRQKLAKPISLIDESQLNRDQRKILHLAMDVVHKVCGADLAEKAAKEIDRRLKTKTKQSNQSQKDPRPAKNNNFADDLTTL